MSKRSEAQDRAYSKAIKTIAEHTVRIALVDAEEQAKEDVGDGDDRHGADYQGYVESNFADNLMNYQCDLIAVDLEDAYNDALEAAGISL